MLDRLRDVKERRGTIEGRDIDAIAADLRLPRAHLHATASFYADLGSRSRAGRHVRICAGTACFAASGGEPSAPAAIAPAGSEDAASKADIGDGTSVEPVYCLGYCYGGPAALDGESACAGPDLLEQLAGRADRRDPAIPFHSAVEDPVVLAGVAGSDPDPWAVCEEVLRSGDSARVHREVLTSRLRGRGGAGFPAGVKWKAAAESPSRGPRYLICNGDEGDPGSFVDRLLMESDPQRLLAGMTLAAFAIGATKGFVYVRSEYPRARDVLEAAVAAAREAGRLGSGGPGAAGFEFDVEVFEGAGSYVAGEETSLLHSMEGLRGEVQARPPYPTERGLLHEPTVVNNVETLCAIPWIVAHGGERYAAYGTERSRGTKVVCLNERFVNPGAYEVELGIPVREIVEGLGGGVRPGHGLRALQVGGPLGGYLAPDQLETPLSFEGLRAAGADLGHGSLIALDERIEREALLLHFWRFAASESCGTCIPCRLGSRRGLELAAGDGGPESPGAYADMLATLEHGSLCAFGRSIPQVVRSLERVYGSGSGERRSGPSTPQADHA